MDDGTILPRPYFLPGFEIAHLKQHPIAQGSYLVGSNNVLIEVKYQILQGNCHLVPAHHLKRFMFSLFSLPYFSSYHWMNTANNFHKILLNFYPTPTWEGWESCCESIKT